MRDFTVIPIEKQRYDGHIDFPTQYKLALQARQSSKEQRLHNQESYESQTTVLLEHALDLGWRGMEVDIIPFLENKSKNGKIIDASGTKRIDERPTMQDLWYHIEHDIVKAVMTRGVDRLFRHIDMREPAMFAKLCKQHRCIIITVKEVRHRTKIEVYNFHENPEDTGRFLAEARDAADYISNQIDWMNRCKMNKGLRGEYDGRTVPVGFILDTNRAHFIVYEPHARVVCWIFRRYRELGGNFAALKQEIKQKIAEQGYVFPFFPDNMRHQRVNLDSNGEGYTISARGLKMLLTNLAYIGIWQVYETIDKDTDHPQRVLRASIENNHPAIVDSVDFWYAYDRLTDIEQPRSRYTKVGTTSCDALLEGIVTSEGMEVYVYQKAQEPDGAVYVIADNEVLYGNRVHGSLYVRDLDRIFSQHLLAKLEDGKKLRDQLRGSEFFDYIDGMENAMMLRLIDVIKAQDISTAGIDAQIAGYSEEAKSLDKTLRFGAAKLSPKKIEEYSERLTKLETTIAQLVFKKDRAAKTQAELAEFNEKLGSIPAAWKDLGIENQRRFVSLVTVSMTLTKPAPHWLQLKIAWLWPGTYSTCYIWQRQGAGESWTQIEDETLRRLYPETDRAIILAALPSRSWTAISNRAHDLQIGRTYQSNSSQLHRLVSVNDATFMAQAGIQLDPQNPCQRIWWQDVSEDDGRVGRCYRE